MRASSPHWLRVLQYLNHFNPDDLDFVAPFDITQNGIADALGITRPHASLVLKKLITDGFVERKMLHIRGGRRRRLAYIISPSGIQVVRAC